MKGSIQLSVNFMVVMILTLTVLGLGFFIFGQLFAGIIELPDSIDDNSQRQLNILLKDTDYAFSKNFLTVQRGKSEVVWLGIVNSYDHKTCYDLDVDDWEGENGERAPHEEVTNFLKDNQADANRQIHYAILIKPQKDTPKAQYSVEFTIKLERCDGEEFVGNPQIKRKLFVKVV